MSSRSVGAPGNAAAWATRSVAAALCLSLPAAAALAGAPPIRTSTANAVPQCVTPQRLMSFLKTRNPAIEPRFAHIAAHYERYGNAWQVRWDYAFFQMAVETNFLSFKRGNGSWGDVKPRQNNFAGLGATGGGVPGDSFPDVGTGVLAQIQHLVVYSGEHVKNPVGPRTRLKQNDILESVAHFKGRTTFTDLSRRWAADRHYGAAIEWVAGNYRATYCTQAAGTEAKPRPRPDKPQAQKKTQLAAAAAGLPPAAALGGPEPKDADASTPPVRTIWSRSKATAPAAETSKPATGPASRMVPPAAVAPEKAPAPKATDATAPVDAAAKEPIVVPTPVEVTPAPRPPTDPTPTLPVLQPAANEETPKAFAFAAAMVAAAAAAAAPATDAAHCRVFSASYGGTKTLLVRASAGVEEHYTALTVLDGFEDSMLAGYVKAHAPGGTSLGTFDTRDAALAKAGELCPRVNSGKGASSG